MVTFNTWRSLVDGSKYDGTPPDSENLYARYDIQDESGLVDGDQIAWTDQTGNGRDATVTGSPAYQTGGSIDPAASTDGSDDGWDATNWGTLSPPFTIYTVVDASNFTGNTNNQYLLEAGNFRLQSDGSSNWRLNSTEWNDVTGAYNGEVLSTIVADGGDTTLRVDGFELGSVGTTQDATELQIAYSGGSDYLAGLWAAIYPYNAGHSPTTVSNVESFLNDRFNLGLGL